MPRNEALELRVKRAAIWENECEKMLALAESEDRDFTPEEKEKWDKANKDIDSLKTRIDRVEQAEARDLELKQRLLAVTPPVNKKAEQEARTVEQKRENAMRGWFLHGVEKGNEEMRSDAAECGLNLDSKTLTLRLSSKAPRSMADLEKRALSVGTTTAGGFTVPDEVMRQIEMSMLFFGGMRTAPTLKIRTASGADLPIPTVNDVTNVGRILTENTAATSTDVVFGQIVMKAYKYSSDMVPVSVELLQDANTPIAELLGNLLGQRIGRLQNTHFTTGDNSAKPQGVVTAASSGKTGAAPGATSILYSELVALMHSVDVAYRVPGRSIWMMSDSTMGVVKGITGNNVPLWQPNISIGAPDTLLGFPVVINNDVAALAVNSKSVLFGDFSKYAIRDTTELTLLRLDERYAELHQVAFLAFMRSDGRTLDAGTDPIKFLTQAAT